MSWCLSSAINSVFLCGAGGLVCTCLLDRPHWWGTGRRLSALRWRAGAALFQAPAFLFACLGWWLGPCAWLFMPSDDGCVQSRMATHTVPSELTYGISPFVSLFLSFPSFSLSFFPLFLSFFISSHGGSIPLGLYSVGPYEIHYIFLPNFILFVARFSVFRFIFSKSVLSIWLSSNHMSNKKGTQGYCAFTHPFIICLRRW